MCPFGWKHLMASAQLSCLRLPLESQSIGMDKSKSIGNVKPTHAQLSRTALGFV